MKKDVSDALDGVPTRLNVQTVGNQKCSRAAGRLQTAAFCPPSVLRFMCVGLAGSVRSCVSGDGWTSSWTGVSSGALVDTSSRLRRAVLTLITGVRRNTHTSPQAENGRTPFPPSEIALASKLTFAFHSFSQTSLTAEDRNVQLIHGGLGGLGGLGRLPP